MDAKKQTAVEWLEFQINARGPKENNPPKWLKELYEQAKALEKEQVIAAHFEGQANRDEGYLIQISEHYYNETYGK